MSQTKPKQKIPLAIIVGLVASIVAASLWAAATFVTGYQLVFMPIGIGLIVGYAVRLLGKGNNVLFGVIGAVFTLAGCFLGHFLSMSAAAAAARNTSVFAILFAVLGSKIDVEFFAESFSVTELVLYALAASIAFVLSFYGLNGKKSVQPVAA